MTQAPFRCAIASEDRGESISGSASVTKAFVFVEHPGPWGVDAFRDARMPEGVGLAFKKRAQAAKAKPLMMRRTAGGSRATEGIRVFAAYVDPSGPFVETTVLDRYEDLAELDVARLTTGTSLGLTPHDGLVMGVCTQGRHDACCAERGRPVAAGLAEAFPDETWELSHLGGDRYAANMIVLPYGLYYGRLDAESARGVARLLQAGELELDHLRGRSTLPSTLQAAEAALRRHVDERRVDAVRVVSRTAADGVTDAVFDVDGRTYAVRVVSTRSEESFQLTCRALRESPTMTHAVTDITFLS